MRSIPHVSKLLLKQNYKQHLISQVPMVGGKLMANKRQQLYYCDAENLRTVFRLILPLYFSWIKKKRFLLRGRKLYQKSAPK